MESFFGDDYTPHGDTHLRTVQKYTEESALLNPQEA